MGCGAGRCARRVGCKSVRWEVMARAVAAGGENSGRAGGRLQEAVREGERAGSCIGRAESGHQRQEESVRVAAGVEEKIGSGGE